MLHQFKKSSILCIALAFGVTALPFQGKKAHSIFFHAINQKNHVNVKNALGKRAALEWKRVGTVYYENENGPGEDTVMNFCYRDTTIYDVPGDNILVKRKCRARSGWEKDSLVNVDSSFYKNGRIAEEINMNIFSGKIDGGYRYVYEYLNDGKVMIATYYKWDESSEDWVPSGKDSMVFSAPCNLQNDPYFDETNYLEDYTFEFDSENSAWIHSGHGQKNITECSSTRFVINGDIDRSEDKTIIIFNSPVWLKTNITEIIGQEKDEAGEYYDTYKYEYTSDGYNEYEYDSTGTLIYADKYISLKDSHGNDTFSVETCYDEDASTWDTSKYRYDRVYDSYGNNTITTTWKYDNDGDLWYITDREVNQFAQLTSPVIHSAQKTSDKKISMINNTSYLSFSAPGITSLNLYSVSGRLVASVKQKASQSVTLDFANSHSRVPSGAYVAELVSNKGKSAFPLVIRR